MRNRKEGSTKRTRETPRKRKSKRRMPQKRLKINKGKHRRINNKNALFRGKTSCFLFLREKSKNKKKTIKNKKKIRRV